MRFTGEVIQVLVQMVWIPRFRDYFGQPDGSDVDHGSYKHNCEEYADTLEYQLCRLYQFL